jgi:hypothetical protein
MSMQVAEIGSMQRAQSTVAHSVACVTAVRGASACRREARAALILADRLGISLDEEVLALYDVRDLQALCSTLQRRLAQ